ncbi:MAG TPA: sensor histidine kinase [Gammaproteobacteria bacterium]|nr:sensor histidine kinase [Gammaproteobacteria bacterium]
MGIKNALARWTNSLAGRILITVLGIHLVILTIAFYFLVKLVENNYTEQFVDYVRTDNLRVSKLIKHELSFGNQEQINTFSDNLLLDGQPVKIIIKDDFGNVVYPQNLDLSKEAPFKEDFFFGDNGDSLYCIKNVLVSDDGELLGSMQIFYDESPTKNELADLYQNGIFIAISYLLIVLVFVGIMDTYITQSLRELTMSAFRIASGKYNEKLYSYTSTYEVRLLAQSLESMRKELVNRGKQLSDREKRIRALLNNISDAVLFCDHKGNIESANQAATRILGYSTKNLLKINFNQIINYDSVKDSMNWPVFEKIFETHAVNKDGTEIPIEILMSGLFQGNKTIVLVLMRDITERRQNELERHHHYTEMTHAGRLGIMGEMAAGIAHELNQPLAAISLYLQGSMRICQPELTDNDKCKEIYKVLKSADEQATRAAGIIRRIKRFVRKEGPNESIETVDLNKLVRKSIEFIFIDKQYACIQPELLLTKEPVLIDVDSLQIEQVLVNLIRNAIEAIFDLDSMHQILKISTGVDAQGYAIVSIIDSGDGIPYEIKDKIFDTYFTTKTEGLGMGLSICRSIIEEHNGELWCDTTIRQGAEFCFKLPPSRDAKPQNTTQSAQA